MKIYMPHIAEIRGRMAYLGISQDQLARVIGIERSRLTRYLLGAIPMPEGMEALIRAALDDMEEEQRVAAEAVAQLRAERARKRGVQ